MAATTSNNQCFCLPKLAENTSSSQISCLVSQNPSLPTDEILMSHACETLEFDLTPLVKIIETIFQNASAATSKCAGYATLSDMMTCSLETSDAMRQALADIRFISYEMSCNLSTSIDATAMAVLKKLKNYSWNAKVALAIASIASNIGELSMLVNHRNTDLIAKSVDLIKGQPLKLDLTVLNNLTKAMMDVVNTNLAFLVPPISKISKGAPSMKDALGYFPIATYKIIRIVVQIASILSKREENIDSTIRCLANEVCNIHAVLQEKLERCRREIAEQTAQCHCCEGVQCQRTEKSIQCQCHEVVQCQPPEQSVRCQTHKALWCQSTKAVESQCHEVDQRRPAEKSIRCQCHELVQCQYPEQSVGCKCHEATQCQSTKACKCHEATQCQSTKAVQCQCHEVQCQSAGQSVKCQCHEALQCQSTEAVHKCQCHAAQCQSIERSIQCQCYEVAQCQSTKTVQCQCQEIQCQPIEQSIQCQSTEAIKCQSTEAIQCQCHEARCQRTKQKQCHETLQYPPTKALQCQCHEARCQSIEQSIHCKCHEARQCQSTEQSMRCQCHGLAQCQSLQQGIWCKCHEVSQCQSTEQSMRCQSTKQSMNCQCHEQSQCHDVVQCQYEDSWELIPKINTWELMQNIKCNMKIQVPESLRDKHVLFLISDLDISIEEIKVLNRLYLKNNQRYEIVWLPIVDISIYDRKKILCLKQLMKWGTVNPCKIGPVVIEFIKKEWNFAKAPIAVSLNKEGEVTCRNALPMLWTWGNLAFPFTDTREKDLWSTINEATGWRLNLLIDENIVPDILSWGGSFVCLFGGENISWVRNFTEKVRMATNAAGICSPKLVYVGKNKCKGLARNELICSGIDVLDCEHRWLFWTRLESILYAKMLQGKSSRTDCVMREALKVLGYAGNGETWAIFSMGSAAMVTTKGEMGLTIMSKYRDWKMNTTCMRPCFLEALRNYYVMIQSRNVHCHGCVTLHLPVLDQIPGIAICPECCREMEVCYTYRCCV